MAETVICYSGELVSRKNAKAAGITRYFTGKPCPHGHIAQRMTSGTACVECVRLRRLRNPDENYERVKAWRKLNPEARTEEARRYREKYPEKVREKAKRWRNLHVDTRRPIEAAQARARRKNDPEGNRRRVAKFKAQREIALAEIAGRPRPSVCDLCRENNIRIVFDHCHREGHFRGWLCDRCNRVLGLVKDSQKLLKAMAKYLERGNGEVDGGKEEQSSLLGFCRPSSFISD